ncbi:MAG: hypothetical protein A2W91_05735 [Bacteroidetes bacterium GWF2_38_335]|nr:MAG: hypothetical protein A2W91_05735 [Bacteroidetes bacterium GWF2_38_335]HBS88926.1 four helix bundle protein [Bacteroidales bacterium]
MKEEIRERFLEFASNIVILVRAMKNTFEGRHVFGQLFRAGTSAGANYEESHSAESVKDFIHKRGIVEKELRESLFWLELTKRAKIISENTNIDDMICENSELLKIIAKSIITIKQRQTSDK